MTLAVFAAIAVLVLRGLIRKPQAIMAVLAGAYIASVALSQSLRGVDLRPLLVGIDAFVVALMVPLWAQYRSQRARVVGALGMVQVGWAIFSGGTGTQWATWAAIENAMFVAQVLVAGGDADGIAAWLGDRIARLRARGAGLLGHVGG